MLEKSGFPYYLWDYGLTTNHPSNTLNRKISKPINTEICIANINLDERISPPTLF